MSGAPSRVGIIIMSFRKAFTLIELLVVIAIIAILAAILVPVFAQAKAAAKKTGSLSNVKQLTLGVILYSGDADDVFPYANPIRDDNTNIWEGGLSWWGPGWAFKVQPYVKNYGIFVSPGDASMTGGAWVRPAMSYAINANIDRYWDGKFGAVQIGGDWTAWTPKPTPSAIGRPSETILLGERHNSDYAAKWTKWSGSGKEGHGMQGNAPFSGVNWMDYWLGPSEVPNGRSTSNWPEGKEGTVSAVWSGKANFSFVDGHAKSMDPVATNPDLDNLPDKNLWDGSRK